MTANINVNQPSPNFFSKESIKQSLMENSNFEKTEAEKIATKITANLKGKKNYTEEDIFKAASSIYNFDSGANKRLFNAIDKLDPKTNIQHWQLVGANLLDDEVNTNNGTSKATCQDISINPDDDSRGMVSRSINRIQTNNKNPTTAYQNITVDSIIQDLEDKKVIGLINNTEKDRNKHLRRTLEAMRDQGVTTERITQATKDSTAWNKLIGTVKETEFQRVLIQDSINKIKKTNQNITVDDIIQEIKVNDKIHDRESLLDTLVAMKNQGITTERITQATKDSTAWNKLIGTVKENQNITVDSIIRYT